MPVAPVLICPPNSAIVATASLLGTALILGGLLAYLFGRLMARPLDEATRVAAAVGHGHPVETKTSALAEANILIHTLSEASAELRKREELAVFLMRELAHRAKNQLAVVKGMALQTARQSTSVDEFVKQFDRRIQGLAQSVDVRAEPVPAERSVVAEVQDAVQEADGGDRRMHADGADHALVVIHSINQRIVEYLVLSIRADVGGLPPLVGAVPPRASAV